MHTLITIAVLACIVCAAITIWFALRAAAQADFATKEAKRCDRRANEFTEQLARLNAVEADVAALGKQHRRLQGRFYKFLDEADLNGQGDAFHAPAAQPSAHRPGPPVAPFCANYGQAQLDGPTSAAARCECAYCAEMRLRRDEFRSKALPKTNSERHDAAKAGLEGRRYERE